MSGVGAGSRKRKRASIVSGSRTFTTSGTFTVPAYSTLVVSCEGGQGASGANGANGADIMDGAGNVYHGGAGGPGGPGGAGGRCVKTYSSGSGPSVASSITVSVGGGGASITFGTNPTANPGSAGGDGTNGGDAYVVTYAGDDTYFNGTDGTAGSAGANGGASGGDSNITGGSSSGSGAVTFSWS